MKKLVCILITITLGCGPVVEFEVPQPEGTKDLPIFPSRLIGKYLNFSDSSIITIDAEQITREYHFTGIIHKAEFENEMEIAIHHDTVLIDEGMKISLDVINDSVKLSSCFKNSIFQISEKNILRKFKGHYFLNKQHGENGIWTVQILKLEKKKLRLENLIYLDEIEPLSENELLESNQDTTSGLFQKPFIVKVKKGDLKKILKTKGSKGEYLKIN
ncbi:hypothetical protein [Flexithrix dorotheae]|uniref:hypothetical protein n=1 Tax=Flexithrix dorotheae TaxID=70993 RepID=UPI00036664FE|nr:hypothetical protein [Flexithrix dorotheae]